MYIIALIVHARSLVSAGRFIIRAVTKALIGGGGEGGAYSYIRVLPDEFLLKSTVMTTDFKRNSSDRTQMYEYPHPPPPINALVTVLSLICIRFKEKKRII